MAITSTDHRSKGDINSFDGVNCATLTDDDSGLGGCLATIEEIARRCLAAVIPVEHSQDSHPVHLVCYREGSRFTPRQQLRDAYYDSLGTLKQVSTLQRFLSDLISSEEQRQRVSAEILSAAVCLYGACAVHLSLDNRSTSLATSGFPTVMIQGTAGESSVPHKYGEIISYSRMLLDACLLEYLEDLAKFDLETTLPQVIQLESLIRGIAERPDLHLDQVTELQRTASTVFEEMPSSCSTEIGTSIFRVLAATTIFVSVRGGSESEFSSDESFFSELSVGSASDSKSAALYHMLARSSVKLLSECLFELVDAMSFCSSASFTAASTSTLSTVRPEEGTGNVIQTV